MRHTFICIHLFFLNFVLGQDWHRGAFVILDQVGAVEILDYLGERDEPSLLSARFQPGNVAIYAAEGAELCLLNSNRVMMVYSGKGKLSFERFEHLVDMSEEENVDGGDSRMILELKSGNLVIDSSRNLADAHLVIETPFGRITIKDKSLINIAIVENKKRKRLNFEIECSFGSARFVDRQGDFYELYGGQRLSGYSKDGSLSLGFSQVSNDIQSTFRQYSEKLLSLDLAEFDYKQFKPHMGSPIQKALNEDKSTAASGDEIEIGRPIIIDIAPLPAPSLPIRAIKR